jgi:hypothetical protein
MEIKKYHVIYADLHGILALLYLINGKAWGFNMEKGQLKIGDFSNGD